MDTEQQTAGRNPAARDLSWRQIGVRIVGVEPRLRDRLRQLTLDEGASVEVVLEWIRDGGNGRRRNGGTGAASSFARRLQVNCRGGRIRFLKVGDIDWIEAANQYVRLHLGPHRHLIRESLTRLASRLDPRRFRRIHRSAIVNLDRVVELQTESPTHHRAVLADGHRLQVSQTHWDSLREALLGLG